MIQKLHSKFFPHDLKKGHSKSLDGLRGFAAILVVIGHASNNGLVIHPYLNFSLIEQWGVYLFFIMSAYLLDIQIIRKIKSGKANFNYWFNYACRRFFRIYPLFLVALVAYYLAHISFLKNFITSWQEVFEHLGLLKGEVMFWSIPVEFIYYFLSPVLVITILYLFKSHFYSIFLFLLSSAALIIIYDLFIENLPHLSTLKFLPIFFTGTILAFLEELKPKFLVWPLWITNLVGFIALFLIFLAIPLYFNLIFDFNIVNYSSWSFPIVSFIMILLLITSHFNRGLISRFFSNKILRFFGSISFSLYLFHWLIILLVNEFVPTASTLKVIVFYFITILFSSITYLLVEYPFSQKNFYFKIGISSRKRVEKIFLYMRKD